MQHLLILYVVIWQIPTLMKNKTPLYVKIESPCGKYMYDIFLAPLGLLEQKIISYLQCICGAQK